MHRLFSAAAGRFAVTFGRIFFRRTAACAAVAAGAARGTLEQAAYVFEHINGCNKYYDTYDTCCRSHTNRLLSVRIPSYLNAAFTVNLLLLCAQAGEKRYIVCNQRKYIGEDESQTGGEAHPFPGIRFTFDDCESRYTRHVEEAEHHERERYGRIKVGIFRKVCYEVRFMLVVGLYAVNRGERRDHDFFSGRAGNEPDTEIFQSKPSGLMAGSMNLPRRAA